VAEDEQSRGKNSECPRNGCVVKSFACIRNTEKLNLVQVGRRGVAIVLKCLECGTMRKG
jgi:hypothetical protein